MIIGIGTDIVEVERIERAINRTPSFINGVYTENEIEHFSSKGKHKYESASGIFAAKEAVSKALGSGVRGFGLKDIEDNHTEIGMPIIKLSNKIEELFKLNNYKIHVTISHTKENAISFVVIEEVN